MQNQLSRLCYLVFTSSVVIGSGASHGPAATHSVNDLSEIEAALHDVGPGDEIIMRSGVWRDVQIRFEARGHPGAPITLRAQQPGRTILCGQSRLAIVGEHLAVDGLVFTDGHLVGKHVVRFGDSRTVSHQCRLTNTSIVAYNPAERSTKYFWVAVDGTQHRIDHCFFSGMNHEGVVIKVEAGPTPGDHRIDHNYFGNRPRGDRNGYETIRIGNSTTSMFVSRTVVEYNYFEKCDGEHEIISSKCCENLESTGL